MILVKIKNWREVRVILFYCIYSLVNDKLLLYLENRPNSENIALFLLSLFTIVEYAAFSLIIYEFLRNKTFKKIILYSLPLFVGCFIILFIQSISANIDSISITVEYIAIIIFTLFYFFDEINEPKNTFIYSTSSFWAITGILIYSAGTFFLFLYSDSLTKAEFERFSFINYVFTFIKNACFAVSVTIKPDPENLNPLETSDPVFLETPLNQLNSNP